MNISWRWFDSHLERLVFLFHGLKFVFEALQTTLEAEVLLSQPLPCPLLIVERNVISSCELSTSLQRSHQYVEG